MIVQAKGPGGVRAALLLLAAALLPLVPACDRCPTDPNKMDPGVCGCGIPDVDSDGDGVLDCNDGCPDDPLKTDPGACGCGVPDTDSDGDGVPDCIDTPDQSNGGGQGNTDTGGDTSTDGTSSEATLGAALTCAWVTGWQTHGPMVTEFDEGEPVHFYLEWQPTSHDFFGDVVAYEWYHNGLLWSQSAYQITEHLYGAWWHDWGTPSVGSGYIKVYWNGHYLGKTNDYTVGIWLGETITCEWVSGWRNHGPMVAQFDQGQEVHVYLEWLPTSHDFFGDVVAYKWYHNGTVAWEETHQIATHLNGVWWHALHTPSAGTGYIEAYWNGRSLGKTNAYTVSAPPPPTLLSPLDGASGEATSATLDWSDVPGAAGYRVQIGTSCGAGAEYDTTASQYDYSGLQPGTYYWRVSTKNAYGVYGSYSTCFSFTATAPPPSGACCSPDGSCAVTVEATCTGVWHPEWADCGVAQCPQLPDCNSNGVDDAIDITSGTSLDCNANSVPDECDLAAGTSQDCNGNGIPDECDIASGTSLDVLPPGGDGIPDECQSDCNGNLVPDNVDIANGTSLDCNGNGVPDECDIAGGTSPDCNANNVPDECDLATGASQDCNANGIPDECDIASGVSLDVLPPGGDGIPDECQSDCNGNLIPDSVDIASGTSLDCNGNDIPDECDIASGTSQDCNANGVPDTCDLATGTSQDCNANGIPDECDIASGVSLDVLPPGGDGIPDECQSDCNGNLIPDSADIASGTSLDCNANAVPDECDLAAGTSQDCNANGIPDECDIASGVSLDVVPPGGDGIPDECQTGCTGT